jgi:hypothetical protein
MAKNRRFVVTLEIEVSVEEIERELTKEGLEDMITNALGCETGIEEVEIIKIKEKKTGYKDGSEEGVDDVDD